MTTTQSERIAVRVLEFAVIVAAYILSFIALY